MKSRVMFFLFAMLFTVSNAIAQPGIHTSKTGGEVLRLIRNEKLDLILPGAIRDNKVDMWIHVTRPGVPDPLTPQFGRTSGYLIFTDLGDRIERAVFGSAGAVENIDVRGSTNIAQAISGLNYNNLDPRQGFSIPEVYEELKEFVAERDPKTIAINYSDWITTADGISHTQYLKLEEILGPKYSARFISAENVITDFLVRRTLREITAQANTFEMSRQIAAEALSRIRPGITTIREITWWAKEEAFKRGLTGYSTWSPGGIRVYYSAKSERIEPPDARHWIRHGDYVLQPGDFFAFHGGVSYLGFGTDVKTHAYIMRKGETKVPESIQYAYDQAIKAIGILRPHVRVGMTSKESLDAMVKAIEDAGYIYTELTDSRGLNPDGKGTRDYMIIQDALANTDKSGIYIDFHAMGNNGSGLNVPGASMAAFRPDVGHVKIQENHLFAFEYAVHTNLPERPGYPISINISNPQVVSSRGVEWIQPPNEKIVLIH